MTLPPGVVRRMADSPNQRTSTFPAVLFCGCGACACAAKTTPSYAVGIARLSMVPPRRALLAFPREKLNAGSLLLASQPLDRPAAALPSFVAGPQLRPAPRVLLLQLPDPLP